MYMINLIKIPNFDNIEENIQSTKYFISKIYPSIDVVITISSLAILNQK